MLEVKDLSYRNLLHRISLSFPSGTITGILGPNGSGKTTFLKTLKHIWKPTSGDVFWKSEPVIHHSEVMSLVPQNPLVTFGFRVDEFLTMGCYPSPVAKENLLNQTLHLMELESLRDRPITELSGG